MAGEAAVAGRVAGAGRDSTIRSGQSGPVTGWQAAFGALAVMGALLLNLLLFHQYPVWTREAGIALAVLAGFALIYGAVYRFAPALVRALLEGVLIALALDAAGVHSPWPITAGLAVAAFVALGRKSVLPFVTVASLVAAGAGAMGIGQSREAAFTEIRKGPAAAAPSGLPTIVHIILDEHVGFDGLPADNPRTPAVKAELERFYLGNGFRLYTRAHSDYAYTLNSIPQILNFGEAQEPDRPKQEKKTVKNVAYFNLLGQQGYRVKVHQSEYLNLCSPGAVTDCLTYQSQNIGPVATSSLSTGSRAQIILRKLVSPTVERLAASTYGGLRKLGLPLPVRDVTELRVNPLNAALAFDRFNASLEKAQPGEVHFGHFLLPHSPFGLEPDCRLKEGAWMRRQYPGPFGPRQNAGFDQMLCTLRKTEAAYRAISRSPAGRNFIMIVHGDHGSRLTNAKPIADQAKFMTDEEKVANFSAFFAVRAPAIQGGKDTSPLALSTLVKGLAKSHFAAAPERGPGGRAQVNLDDEGFVPREKIFLPEGW